MGSFILKNRKKQDLLDTQEVFCSIRKKYVKKTPEESIRQRFLGCLIQYKGFRSPLIAVEVTVKKLLFPKIVPFSGRRVDIVCYSLHKGEASPLLLIECKASVPKDTIISQLAGYQAALKSCIVGVVFEDQIILYDQVHCVYEGPYAQMPSYETFMKGHFLSLR